MKKIDTKSDAQILRQKAEERLKEKSSSSRSQLSEVETLKLIHELEVHQIELEMQNDELLSVQSAAQEAAEKYLELYDFAPMGYCTLSEQGRIKEINLCGAALLGKERLHLQGAMFDQFVSNETRPTFRQFLLNVFSSKTKETCEGALSAREGLTIFLSFTGIAIGSSQQCLVQFTDITERKIAEQTLSESVEKYRVLLNGSSVGIFAADVGSHQFLFSNPAICKLFGYTDEEFKRLSIENLLPKESLDLILSEFDSQMLGENSVSYAQPCIRKEGTVFNADISGAPIVLNGRKCIVGFFTDVTERKKTDEALRLSEEKYSSLFENVQDVFYQIDLTGMILDISPSIKHFSEFKRDELIGANVSELYFNTDERVLFLDEIKKKGEVRDYELIIRTKNGKKRFASINASLISDTNGNPNHIDGALRDVSERKRAEEALIESRKELIATIKQLEIAQQTGHIGSWNFNLKTQTLNGSAEARQLFGLQGSENSFDLQQIEDRIPDRERVHQALIDLVTNDTPYDLEYLIHPADGSKPRVIISKAVIEKDANGNPIAVNGIIQDISERKKSEQELINAMERAEESDRLKSAFLANMSHEIRTPMNGILGFAELLKEPHLTDDEQQQYFRIIEKSGKRMLNIINDIVSISKIEAGQMNVSISATNINEQIESLSTFFTPEVEKKSLQLSIKNTLPSGECLIKTDREKLYAILTNLVDNALKFTSAGSIELGAEKKGSYLEFFVKDTGCGVPGNKKEIIFERFRQGSELLSKPYEGAGLGLSISKAYVEMLGGKIWMESLAGKGSTFYFTIPYDVDEITKPTINKGPAKTEADHRIKVLKVLIAEDDDDSASFLCKVLKTYCNEILTAETGVEAVESCRKNPDLDLILMDIKMPLMNGYEATRQIRKFNKDVVVIAQTAYAMDGDREKAIEAGCNDHLPKPIRIEELRRLMQQYFVK